MAKFTSKEKSIKEMLDEQPKVSILIPSNPALDPEVDYRIVRINGYGYKVMAGEQVEVPEAVAEILKNSDRAIAQIKRQYADMTVGGGRNLSKNEAPVED